MEKLISCCGLDCMVCDARKATITNDDNLRTSTAAKWQKEYGASGITPEMINCTGCLEPGAKFSHCLECEIRKCAISKGFKTCSDCSELKTCNIIAPIINNVPGALQNLLDLRNWEKYHSNRISSSPLLLFSSSPLRPCALAPLRLYASYRYKYSL